MKGRLIAVTFASLVLSVSFAELATAQDQVVVNINPLPVDTALVANVNGKEVSGRYGFPANLFDPNKNIEVWEVVCPDGTKIVLKDATVPWPGMYDACEKRQRLGAFLWGSGNPSFAYPSGAEAFRRLLRPYVEGGVGLSTFRNAGASCDTIRGRFEDALYNNYDCAFDGSSAGAAIGGGVDVAWAPNFGTNVFFGKFFGGGASNIADGTRTIGNLRFQQESVATLNRWSVGFNPYYQTGRIRIGPTIAFHRWSNEVHTTGSLQVSGVTVRTDDVTTKKTGTSIGLGGRVSYELVNQSPITVSVNVDFGKTTFGDAFGDDEPGGWERDRDELEIFFSTWLRFGR